MTRERPNLTFLIGGALALLVVALFATGAEQRAVGVRRELLASHATTVGLSVGRLAWIPTDPERDAALLDLGMRLKAYGEQDPRLLRVSVLEASDAPDRLVLLSEWSRAEKSRDSGTTLDIRDRPSIFRGLRETTVASDSDRLSAYVPLARGEGRPALVAVDLDVSDVVAGEAGALRTTIVILLLAVIGFLLLGVGARRLQPRPERSVVPEPAPEGDVTPRGPPPRSDPPHAPEQSLLEAKIETMQRTQQEREFIREAFGRYMSLRVAEAASGQLDVEPLGEERQVSIVAVHLGWKIPGDGSAPPEEVVALINAVLAAANEVVDAQHGCILDFSATSLIVSFGAPVRLEDHAERAVR